MKPTIQMRPEGGVRDSTAGRRAFLRNTSLAAAALLARSPFAWTQADHPFPCSTAVPDVKPDYRMEISEIEWELSPEEEDSHGGL